ncbi:MAG: nuclear transport factor 2 family protein [Bacteroidota bacterium]
MNKKNTIAIPFLSLLFFMIACLVSKNSIAQTSKQAPTELYKEIAHMDSVLFNAFNSRDVEKLKTLFTEDLEFYHDLGGLTNYTQNMEAFKNTAEQKNDLRRELIPGSFEVYPVKDYGAMEIGQHRFCHTENGKPDCGTFKFVHIWKKVNNEWRLSRVISYGH